MLRKGQRLRHHVGLIVGQPELLRAHLPLELLEPFEHRRIDERRLVELIVEPVAVGRLPPLDLVSGDRGNREDLEVVGEAIQAPHHRAHAEIEERLDVRLPRVLGHPDPLVAVVLDGGFPIGRQVSDVAPLAAVMPHPLGSLIDHELGEPQPLFAGPTLGLGGADDRTLRAPCRAHGLTNERTSNFNSPAPIDRNSATRCISVGGRHGS
ncbi:unannotated protein [freshwater metagenome]|uniref:Unannotated protein n=1 Tax=freshwater metagenome TaxID=449393 RepID=A0A6J5YFJ4_9ZZZZ